MPHVSHLDPTVTHGVADTRPEAGQRSVMRRGRCAEDTAADAADTAITPMYRAGLLVPNRVDGIQPGRLDRRVQTEDDADDERHREGEEHREHGEPGGPLRVGRDAVRDHDAKEDADGATAHGHQEAFGQEL